MKKKATYKSNQVESDVILSATDDTIIVDHIQTELIQKLWKPYILNELNKSER